MQHSAPAGRRLAALALAATAVLAGACHRASPAPLPTPARANGPGAPTTPMPGVPTPGTPGTPTSPSATSSAAAGLAAMMGALGGEPMPRPYSLVVTPGARSQTGLVTTHQVRGRLYFEIPAAQLGRDMLIVRSLRGTQAPIGLAGTLGGSRLVRWERRDHRILLRGADYRNVVTDTTSPIRRAVEIVQFTPILAAFNVEAYGRDSAPVIEVTRIFTGGVSDLIQGNGIGGLPIPVSRFADPSRSFIERVSTYARNVEIEASQTFGSSPLPTTGTTPNPLAALFGAGPSGTELYHFSIVRLPDVPMQPRLYDERVGFFATQQADFGSHEQRVAKRTFINRWRLECSDRRDGALCWPRRPITYYVDPATPTWLVPWIKRGIEEWQPAFEQAGFRQGIVAREVPRDSLDLIHGEDANVSMVRWLPSAVENAVGPSTVDPRSGEILDADVQMYHNVMNLVRSWYFTQAAHLDPRAQKLPMPDSLMGRLMEFIVAHEVGHTLGFPHNMKGSSMYPLDSVRSRTWVARMGHSPSIMDYARFNYVAQPEDKIALGDLIPRVGPYDRFAVQWGYRPLPSARTPDDERPALDRLARAQDSVPWLRFGSDMGIYGSDPGEASEAVGDADAVRATTLGLKNIQRVARLVEPATTAKPGETYADLEELYERLVGQWETELGHVARIPGGQSKQEKVVGQPGAVYTPVPRARQKAAVAFLNDHAFTTPRYLLDTSILRRIEAAGSLERIGGAQRRVLATLLDNQRLQRMVEIEALATDRDDVYTLGELLGDLRRGVWSELARGETIDPYRRRLQRAYLETVGSKINPAPMPTLPPGLPPQIITMLGLGSSSDARALLRGELVDLDRELAAAVPRTADRTTRLHLQDAREQIDRILHPNSR